MVNWLIHVSSLSLNGNNLVWLKKKKISSVLYCPLKNFQRENYSAEQTILQLHHKDHMTLLQRSGKYTMQVL